MPFLRPYIWQLINMTKKWVMPIPNWNAAMAHFLIKFEGRI
ncbi:putative transposase [Rickettsia parkeri str. AT|nr:putative transposase [Rickettsia parkeri str. AT\